MKNKKITVYELMGLIKDGKAPERIKFHNKIYYWSHDTYTQHISTPDNQVSLFREYRIDYMLNDTVEILPEEVEWENIEELGMIYGKNTKGEIMRNRYIINKLIKNQRKIIEKLESKDESRL